LRHGVVGHDYFFARLVEIAAGSQPRAGENEPKVEPGIRVTGHRVSDFDP